MGGPNAQGQTVQQQLDWYKLIYALAEENINSGGPLKVRPRRCLAPRLGVALWGRSLLGFVKGLSM